MRCAPVLETATGGASGQLVERIDVALHGLCQPLTVLQCRLALGEMLGTPEALHEAIRESLRECGRLNDEVGRMRAMLQQAVESVEIERA